MFHVDIPTRPELERLIAFRAPACVSIYLPTTPKSQAAEADRIALDNLIGEAEAQLAAVVDDRAARMRVRDIVEGLAELVDDDAFWRLQARSLAVFATPTQVLTYRLANRLTATVEVSDRFHIKPLLRAVTTSQEAFVLALSQDAVRLVEVTADLPPTAVRVPQMPRSLADAVGRGSLESRSPRGRLQGSEGKKVRMGQYARAVDQSLRAFLAGREEALIIAATSPMDDIFKSHCTYPRLAERTILGNPDTTSDHELAQAARGIIEHLRADETEEFAALFDVRTRAGRTTTDIAEAARAATFGAVAAIAVDIDATVPGILDDENGSVTLAATGSAETYGVVDQIAARVLATGGRVLALRRNEIPGGGELAAVLRYAAPPPSA